MYVTDRICQVTRNSQAIVCRILAAAGVCLLLLQIYNGKYFTGRAVIIGGKTGNPADAASYMTVAFFCRNALSGKIFKFGTGAADCLVT